MFIKNASSFPYDCFDISAQPKASDCLTLILLFGKCSMVISAIWVVMFSAYVLIL